MTGRTAKVATKTAAEKPISTEGGKGRGRRSVGLTLPITLPAPISAPATTAVPGVDIASSIIAPVAAGVAYGSFLTAGTFYSGTATAENVSGRSTLPVSRAAKLTEENFAFWEEALSVDFIRIPFLTAGDSVTTACALTALTSITALRSRVTALATAFIKAAKAKRCVGRTKLTLGGGEG